MATGYDTRQPGRPSFAPEVAAPIQIAPNARGVSNGAQVVGGNAEGQAITVGPQTAPGSIGGNLGEYFGKLMQPYVERKQQERFFEGYTAAQQGKAVTVRIPR